MPVGDDELLVAPSTPTVHETEGWVVHLVPYPSLLVVPPSGRWVAATSHTGAKVDLCRQIRRGAEYVEFVDVELDVVWHWGEPARLVDVEEFESLDLPDAADYLAEAERIRACVDAGEAPFGPAFRQRLVELAPPGDPLLQRTWAGAVGPLLAGEVVGLVGERWLDRQRAGDGWLLAGGVEEATAVAWVGGDGQVRLLAGEGTAMGSYLLEVAPALRAFPAPPLRPSRRRRPGRR